MVVVGTVDVVDAIVTAAADGAVDTVVAVEGNSIDVVNIDVDVVEIAEDTAFVGRDMVIGGANAKEGFERMMITT